ncbi:MAG: diguanylate cyclase [Myxococcales bacterium]|nr:diguanylate cyclase [Myxococcales bacterium]
MLPEEAKQGSISVLVIDDDPAIHELMDFYLEGLNWEVLHALRPDAGVSIARATLPGLILLDIKMPETDGFEVLRRLKEHASTRDIPVIFLTSDGNPNQIERALNAGGADYVTKPVQQVELRARICAAARTRRLVELLRVHASIDPLTGLKNRGAFDSSFAATLASCGRTGQPFGLLLLDLDHFKFINDSHGHGVGDEVLRQVGCVIEETTRAYDVAARYGGEEFAVILNQTGEAEARRIALRTLEHLHQIQIPTALEPLKISGSGGLVCVARDSEMYEAADVLRAADTALYEAKSAGRDRLVCGPVLRARPKG